MASQQDNYIQTILLSKCVSACWAIKLIEQEKAGQDIKCSETKLMLLVRWIRVLQTYYFDNYSTYAGQITPTVDCLTAAQASLLMAKVNILVKQCP